MTAPVILVDATPRRAADGVAVPVLLAGGGAVLPYPPGYRAGVTGLPKSTASLAFDGEQLGGGGVAQALEIGWSPATDAALAELAGLFWKDAPITVRVGPEGAATPPVTATGLVLEHAVEDGVLRIALADATTDLKRPLLVDRYAGTGGVEGPVEWEGQIKTRAWGRCFNVPGRCIDTANNIWCFGDPTRPWQAFDELRDRGVAADSDDLLTLGWQGSAAATFAALQTSAAPEGGGVLCASIASVKWWTAPDGDLRADIRGETAGGYVETAAEIAGRLVAARSTLTFAAGAVAAAAAARPAPFGWRVDGDTATAAGELSDLLAGVSLSWLIVDGQIEFRSWEWTAPVRSARSEGVKRRQVYAPVATRKLGYRRNWAPMARGELGAAVLKGDKGDPGDDAPLVLTQWSVDGVTGWHADFDDADLYQRQSNDNGATWGPAVRVVGESADPGVDGTSPSQIFKRSPTAPVTPGLGTGDPPPGWSDGPPAGTDFLWMSKATFRGSDQLTAWSAPQRISGEKGDPGAAAPLVLTQWSADGVTGWHADFDEGDLYQRQSNDNGATWGPAVRVVGESAGAGQDGVSPSIIFRRSATVPATPATGTGNPPPGWSDGPPAGTDFLWQSVSRFRGGTQLQAWSVPVRISGQDGASAPLLLTQWSVDGVTGWHANYLNGDIFARQSNDNGATFGAAYRAIGESGDVGTDGTSPSQVFKRSATVPSAPTDNTGNPPTGWYDGPPTGTDFIWQSSAKFRGATQLTSWTAPQRISAKDGVSSSTVELSAYALDFAAAFDGTIKTNQQPKSVQASFRVGEQDVTASTAWSIPDSANCTASVNAVGKVSITDVIGDGYVVVQGAYGGVTPPAKRASFTRTKDAAPPAGATSLSQNTSGQVNRSPNTFPAGVSSPILTVTADGNGKLQCIFSITYFCDATGGGTLSYSFVINGIVRYRAAGSNGAWNDFSAGQVSGSPSVSTNDEEPPSEGSLDINHAQNGLTTGVQYEVGVALRYGGGPRSPFASYSGTITVRQP